MKIIICYLIVFLSFGCNKSEESLGESLSVQTIKLPEKEEKNYDMAVEEVAYTPSSNNAASMKNAASMEKPIDTKIIKTGDLRFQSNDLQETYNQIIASVKANNGTIQNDTEGKDYESLFRNITVRIPSKNFDGFLTAISKGVTYFDRKEISSQDVTEEYIDIDARLKAKKVLEARYLELLKKASKVSEMLEIETQLSSIREEIESKEGQLRYMQSQVSMSTISIQFYKPVAAETGITVSYGTKIWNAIQSGFNGISSFFIGLIQLWPFILILVGTFYFIRRRFKRKKL